MRVELALAVALAGCVASQAPAVLSPARTSASYLPGHMWACETGEPGSADAVVENVLLQCHAMPNQ